MRSQALEPLQATDGSASRASKVSKTMARQRHSSPLARNIIEDRTLIGWREWVGLPELGAPSVKAKIDTGARTSALHAFRIRPFEKNGVPYVEFFIHPVQRRRKPEIRCEAQLLGQRRVTSSTGHSEMRYVVETIAEIGNEKWTIELTLANRDQLGFRLLIGRQALRDRFIVDPSRSYCGVASDDAKTLRNSE